MYVKIRCVLPLVPVKVYIIVLKNTGYEQNFNGSKHLIVYWKGSFWIFLIFMIVYLLANSNFDKNYQKSPTKADFWANICLMEKITRH